jgi:hypothetical protein
MARARVVAAILVALFALLTLFDRFVLIQLAIERLGLALLWTAASALACIGAGALLRRKPHVDPALDFLIGYPIFGTLCFLVGLVRINSWTMGTVTVIGAVTGTVLLVRSRRALGGTAPLPATNRGIAFLCVAAVLACGFVTAQAPPASLDELAYHLAVPHTWLLEGRPVALPLLSQSWFPQGIESADLPALALLGPLSGGIASHFLHWLAALGVVVLVARRAQSWLIVAAIVTTPALAVTTGWSLVDWPLLGLFVVLATAEDDHTASAATAAGLLVKYTFLPFAALYWILRRRLPRAIALLGVVFFARNMLLSGNPVAPFFGPDAPHVAGYRALELSGYVFDGAFLDEALGASLLALPILGTGTLALASLGLAFLLFLLGPSSRILIPFLAVPAMESAALLRRRFVPLLIAIAVAIQTMLVVYLTARSNAFSLLEGSPTDEAYLQQERPAYASVQWVNASLPPDARALVVGLGESYWFTKPVRAAGNFDQALLSRYLDLQTPEALRARLKSDGITHVAVLAIEPPTRDAKKLEERRGTLTPAAQRMLAQTLDRYASHMSSRGTTALFTLK